MLKVLGNGGRVAWEHQLRADVGQWLEYKTAAGQLLVGDVKNAFFHHLIAKVEDIEIDDARSIALVHDAPAEVKLDALGVLQQLKGRADVIDFNDGVEEIGRLRWAIDRFRLINGCLQVDGVLRHQLAQHVSGHLQVGQTIAKVRPESDAYAVSHCGN